MFALESADRAGHAGTLRYPSNWEAEEGWLHAQDQPGLVVWDLASKIINKYT